MEFEYAKKILLVNKNPDLLDQMKKTLEDESKSVEVTPVFSAILALKMLEKKDFDVIVSDYKVSDMGGIEFLNEIRETRKIGIPFILFTEKMKQDIVLKALKAGANRVLYRRDDIILFCKVLNQVLKKEILHHERKKEIEHHRKNLDSDIRGF